MRQNSHRYRCYNGYDEHLCVAQRKYWPDRRSSCHRWVGEEAAHAVNHASEKSVKVKLPVDSKYLEVNQRGDEEKAFSDQEVPEVEVERCNIFTEDVFSKHTKSAADEWHTEWNQDWDNDG